MTAEDEALKLALHGLEMGVTLIEDFGSKEQLNTQHKAIAAIYEALAQPEQEPVAWFSTLPDGRLSIKIVGKPTEGNWEPLYTTPPQRTWSGLTDEEMQSIAFESADALSAVFVAEAKLKEKNT